MDKCNKCGLSIPSNMGHSCDGDLLRTTKSGDTVGEPLNQEHIDYLAGSKSAAEIHAVTDNLRTFDTGATRSPNVEPDGEMKHDLLGFFSPLVTKRRAEFMTKNRVQSDGAIRDGDNWKKGMPFLESFRSLKRHILDMELIYEGSLSREGCLDEHICAAMFNLESMLLTRLEEEGKCSATKV